MPSSSPSNGDAISQILPAIYADLRSVAEQALAKEQVGHTLQTTALVNEVYLRLAKQQKLDPQNRPQFLALAATMIRRILVDHTKQRQRLKRGGQRKRIELNEASVTIPGLDFDVLSLHEALEHLHQHDEAMSRLVELRFFAGLSVAEAAEVLGQSSSATQRQWEFARSWLRRELSERGAKHSDQNKAP